jgi:glycerophosphoryl diester phosphodiesterase
VKQTHVVIQQKGKKVPLQRFTSLIVALVCAASASASQAQNSRVAALIENLHDPSPHPPVLVIAHRSCWWDAAPENSLSAIRNCIAMGPDGIEVDVVKTSDDQLVVMHDLTVDRMTEATGQVAKMTLAQVTALHLRKGAGGPKAELTDEHVPSLEEALRLARDHFIIHLHLKEGDEDEEVVRLVDRMGMGKQVTVWMNGKPGDKSLQASPFYGHVNVIETINECGFGNPCFPMPVEDLSGYAQYHPVAFNVNYKTHEFLRQVTAARPEGVRIEGNTLYGFDTGPMDRLISEWTTQLDAGVTMILTNRPQELMELIKKRNAASR